MTQRTNKFRLPQLKLAHKGIIIVVIPLAVQAGVYLELKRQLSETEEQAHRAETRREIVSRVNELFLNGFDAFQALVYFSVYGGKESGFKRDAYLKRVKSQTSELAVRLERDAQEPATAQSLIKAGNGFVNAFETWKQKLDRENQGLSLFTNIESNERFKGAVIRFMMRLKEIGLAQQAKLAPESTTEQEFRADLKRNLDLAMAVSSLAAILLGLLFLRGTVTNLAILKSNAKRFAKKEMLLPPVNAKDEIGDVDSVFHDMANALTAAQVKEHEMLDQLQAGKDRLDRVIENIPLAVVVTNEQGIIQSFNATAERTFLHKRDDIHGKPLTILFSETSNADASEFLKRLISDKIESSTQMEAVSADREVIPAEVSVTRFDSPEGVRYLATIKDISERFRLEELKRDFYAMVSHDIRTPLSSINGILQLVQRGRYGDIPDEVDDKLATAEKNVDKILELVNKLLEIEKLESGNLELSRAEVKLSDLIAQSLESTGQFANAHKVELEANKTDLSVNADSLYIGNVLTNLISNAIKFSPEKSKVKIETKDLGEMVEVSIIDQGPGVPVRMQAQIFEKYQQAKTTRDRAKGFGLGLAICKSIVELHGGTIGVKSTGEGENSGSRFWFHLPKT